MDVLAKHCPCPEPWVFMDGGDCQRRCSRCQAAVIDVHAMEPAEAEAFLAERMQKPPFVDAFVREDGRVMLEECPAGVRRRRVRRLGAFVAVIGVVFTVIVLR